MNIRPAVYELIHSGSWTDKQTDGHSVANRLIMESGLCEGTKKKINK
jgi:hypothetical protein